MEDVRKCIIDILILNYNTFFDKIIFTIQRMLSYNSAECPMQCIIFWQAKHQAKLHPLEWSVKAAAVHIWCSSLTVNSPLHHPCTPTLRHSQFPVFKHTANVYKRRKTNCKLYLTLSKRFLLHQTGPDAPWACCAMTYRLIPYSQVLVILHSTAAHARKL